MPSYLEIALTVARTPQPARDERKPTEHQPRPVSVPVALPIDPSRAGLSALCGSPHCAGCYEVAPGVRIHPPKSGKGWVQ